MSCFFAHSENDVGHRHRLNEHLSSVGSLAGAFAKLQPWAGEAKLAGLLHDLGKYGDLFQARLRGEVSGLDHWSQGASRALTDFQAVAAAFAIQGHHIGLQSLSGLSRARDLAALAVQHPLSLQLSDLDLSRLTARMQADGLAPEKPARFVVDRERAFRNPLATMLDVRMLFSCLVDADFLDTESHFEGDVHGKRLRQSGPDLNPTVALQMLEGFVERRVRAHTGADETVRSARDALWRLAQEAALGHTGLFTLTAPTGSGKTLAMLRFALEHAQQHDLRRIVLVVPFLTIIEQTAAIYRTIFSGLSNEYVLEHHSLAGTGVERSQSDAAGKHDEAERVRRLLSQNWDAPIVLTTNVQILESLFSNRPGACRKLHRLAESVILFDEAQTLPQSLIVPTLGALSHFAQTYRASVLFATATQPAFESLHDSVKAHTAEGWQPREIVVDNEKMFSDLKRVRLHWPAENEEISWTSVAEQLVDRGQALCIVNLKRHALELLEALHGHSDVYHLSTNLCPAHRRDVLARVHERLRRREHCVLVSTQCVEAGVDVDFPVVYRALAPLDSIAQAAGRCNREGRLRDQQGAVQLGDVHVFNPVEEPGWRRRYPTHAYFQATQITGNLLRRAGTNGLDLDDPATFNRFYRELYDVANPAAQAPELSDALRAVDFAEVAKQYRLINEDTVMVLVPYSVLDDEFARLRDQVMDRGLTADWMRQAQPLAVSLYRPKPDDPVWGVMLPARLRRGGVSDEWFVLEDVRSELYDDIVGLRRVSQQLFIA